MVCRARGQYRAHFYRVHYTLGCPPSLPCCSEFGYCRSKVGQPTKGANLLYDPQGDWEGGYIRDCNGVSNGGALDPVTIAREEEAGAY